MNEKFEHFLSGRGIHLSAAQKELLERYKSIFLDVSTRINLISDSDRVRLEEKHFTDSLAPLELIPHGVKIADWGSGGGLPGIPLAIARPDLKVTVVESRLKKASFLLRVKRELELANVSVFAQRGEELNESFDLITIRAVGKLREVLPRVATHITEKGKLLFYKGPGLDSELRDAGKVISRFGFKLKIEEARLPLEEDRRYLLLTR